MITNSVEALDKFYTDNPLYTNEELTAVEVNSSGQLSWDIVNDDGGAIVGCVYPDGSTFAF